MRHKDVFICHASEDKDQVIRPLVDAFSRAGISCWYDEAEIRWGDSITAKVNEGLQVSKFVIVALSSAFLGKPWPERELNSALHLEASTGEVRVLPLLVASDADRSAILTRYPLLSDKCYVPWGSDLEAVVAATKARLDGNGTSTNQFGTGSASNMLNDSPALTTSSTSSAVQTFKGYIAEEKYRIQLSDFVMQEAERVRSAVFGSDFPVRDPYTDSELCRRIECFESITETLRALIATGLHWGGHGADATLWKRALSLVAQKPEASGWTRGYRDVQVYPALMLFYSGAISSVSVGNYQYFASLANTTIIENLSEKLFLECVSVSSLCDSGLDSNWPGQKGMYTPISNHLFELLRDTFRSLIPLDHEYANAFDEAEYLIALIESDRRSRDGLRPGARLGRFRWSGMQCARASFRTEVDEMGCKAAVLASGLLGGSLQRYKDSVAAIDGQMARLH